MKRKLVKKDYSVVETAVDDEVRTTDDLTTISAATLAKSDKLYPRITR